MKVSNERITTEDSNNSLNSTESEGDDDEEEEEEEEEEYGNGNGECLLSGQFMNDVF